MIYGLMSVSPIQIPGINLILYICQTLVKAVSEDDITLLLESWHIIYHLICEELASVFQGWLLDDNCHTVCFQMLDDVLDGRCPKVVAIALHGQSVFQSRKHPIRPASTVRVIVWNIYGCSFFGCR